MPMFEKDNMAKHHTQPLTGTMPSAVPPEEIRMEFARRLQTALNESGWTQSELAHHMAPPLIS
jgi:ribosome-binding protein aMBF1 (putative translation factor)